MANDFESVLNILAKRFPDINVGLLGCYLCNFEDEYICREYNGGCKNIDICKEIKNKGGQI